MRAPRLSKTRYLSGLQCPLKLWYDVHARDLAPAPDAATEARFEVGHEVGRLARERFAGGRLVAHDHRHPGAALRETRALLADPSVGAIFEAAIERDGVLVRVDVLARADTGRFDLVEVKSGTGPKPVHVPDVAVQAWVLEGAGVALRHAGVLTLDRDYVYPGGALDLDRLFAFHDLREAIEPALRAVGPDVGRLRAMLAGAAPAIAPGEQCRDPYECPYLAHCTRDLPLVEHPVGELPNLHFTRRRALETEGVERIAEIPGDFPLTDLQRTVREAVLDGTDRVHGDLAGALARAEAPVHHLDFETVQHAVPRHPGTRPYDALAFQFSMHVESADGTVGHHEYLHPDGSDPRRPLAEALLAAIGPSGSICTYSGYEARVIRELAAALPDLAPRLEALVPRVFDLLAVVRSSYYHPAFRGSFSIKQVLPVLVPGLDYADLEIADGALAAVRYAEALGGDWVERERIFDDLRAYCARDSLAMLELRRALAARASA